MISGIEIMENERRGFTVMEILIVIVILCIVAAVAVPRVSHAAAKNRTSDMVGKLHLVRSQIRLYKAQHAGLLPGQETEGTGWWLNIATSEFRPCDNKFHTAY